MRQVMFGKMQRRQWGAGFVQGLQFPVQHCAHEKLFPYPDGHGGEKTAQAAGGEGVIGLKQTLEFQKGLVVKDHAFKIRHAQAAFFQNPGNRPGGKGRIVLLAGKAFLMGRGDNPAVGNQRGRAVVVICRDAQNICRFFLIICHGGIIRTGYR